MMIIAQLLAVIATLVIIVRLLTFRRRGCRYRPAVAFTAWGVIALSAATLERLLTGSAGAWWLTGLLVTIAILVIRSGGNVADLLRTFIPHRRH
ncbi:phage holin family protein [Halomonas cupida]|uniref:phage holin family protein n=1 Tax=Halomonas cupida TaxID=44933 RepID=UPI0039B5F828